MKYVSLVVFVVAMSLINGCAGMTCPMGKNAHPDSNIGRYLPINVYNEAGKIDTTTGEVYIYNQSQLRWIKLTTDTYQFKGEKGWEKLDK